MFNSQRTATLQNPFYMKQNFLNKIHTIDTLDHLSFIKTSEIHSSFSFISGYKCSGFFHAFKEVLKTVNIAIPDTNIYLPKYQLPLHTKNVYG